MGSDAVPETCSRQRRLNRRRGLERLLASKVSPDAPKTRSSFYFTLCQQSTTTLNLVCWSCVASSSPTSDVMTAELMKDIIHYENCIQDAAASALMTIQSQDQSQAKVVRDQILALYKVKLVMVPPVHQSITRSAFGSGSCGLTMALPTIVMYLDHLRALRTSVKMRTPSAWSDRKCSGRGWKDCWPQSPAHTQSWHGF